MMHKRQMSVPFCFRRKKKERKKLTSCHNPSNTYFVGSLTEVFKNENLLFNEGLSNSLIYVETNSIKLLGPYKNTELKRNAAHQTSRFLHKPSLKKTQITNVDKIYVTNLQFLVIIIIFYCRIGLRQPPK